MRDDEMGLGIDSTLHIVADQAAVPRAGCHRAGVGVRQGNLAIGSVDQSLVDLSEPRDLLPDAAIAAGQMLDLPRPGLAFLLPVDADYLCDVAFDIGFEIGDAAGDLALGEVPVPAVHGF